MLFILVLCTFLPTLHGVAVPALHPSGTVATADVPAATIDKSQGLPHGGDQPLRTIYTIVKSCLLTLFACVWTSVHPNIQGPRDSWWTRQKRKIITVLYVLIAPELALYWALKQRSEARCIARSYNEKLPTDGSPQSEAKKADSAIMSIITSILSSIKSFMKKVKSLFQLLPVETTIRSTQERWTTTHGFFVQMGGFILYKGKYPEKVLDFDSLQEHINAGDIDRPMVTKRELQDRSKGDTISKGFVVLQTTWFVLQCIARWQQHLPLSELEVFTLAFAVLNLAIYAAWWPKPQRVGMAIRIPWKGAHQQKKPQPVEKPSWLVTQIKNDLDRHCLAVFIFFRLPYRIAVGWVIHPVRKMTASSNDFDTEQLRVPMFYSTNIGAKSRYLTLAVSIAGVIFGAIHFIGWAIEFPSARDLLLWRIATIVLTAVPLVLPLVEELGKNRGIVVNSLRRLLVLCYIAARFIIIVLALKGLHRPPHDVLIDVSWTRFEPHF